jgi:apolipoprotein N-acyltransferase
VRRGAILGAAMLAGAAQATLPSLPWPLQLPVACVVLVPLLVALPYASARVTVVAGIVYATVLAEVAFLPWLGAALGRYFALSWPAAQLLSATVAATLGLFHGTVLGAALALRPRGTGALVVLWYGALWALWEPLRDWVPPYFQGAALGASLENSLALLQLASVTGVAGVTAVVVAANAGIAGLSTRTASRAARARACATGVALVAVATAWGATRLATPLPAARDDATTVLAIDVDASDASESTLDVLLQATPAEPRVDLVLWPESALNLDLARDRAAWRRVADFVAQRDTTLVTGGITVQLADADAEKRFNALHVVRPGFGIESYHKRLLVPLTEAWPAFLGDPPDALEPVDAGTTLPVLHAGRSAFGPLVCFEIGDAASARTLARDGARFLLHASNDVWFRGTEAPHLRWARVRAIESGLPVVRVANAGMSGVIDPHGRVVFSSTPSSRPGVLAARVPEPVPTAFVATGEWFLPACAIVVLLGAVASVGSRRALVAEAVVGRGGELVRNHRLGGDVGQRDRQR